jgi:hypothetical protein
VNIGMEENTNMAALYMECILYLKNYKHGDDANSEIKKGNFSLYTNYKYQDTVKKKKQETIFLWFSTSLHTVFRVLRGLGRTCIYVTPPTYCSIYCLNNSLIYCMTN